MNFADVFSRVLARFNLHFEFSDPSEIALNAGLSALVAAAAFAASFVFSNMCRIVYRGFQASLGKDRRAKPPKSVTLIARLGALVIWLTALAVILGVWNVGVLNWATGEGAPQVTGALRIIAIIVVALIAWEGVTQAIEAAFNAAANRSDTPRRAAQLRSLTPMTRGAVRIVIGVFAIMLIISELGVEIGPLIAGAGVVGVAVGFGAQTLVKDYLTGFLLILEDVISVGDIARIGGNGGLVESMTMRTIRLRDFDGTLHIIPYSEAQVIHNLTKTFSCYVFNLQIAYSADIDKAIEIMRTIGQQMQADEAYADSFLEPIEVVGVDALADSGVVIKARIKTPPLRQWIVGREYNRRIKLAFDEAGIEIPFPHMKVVFSNAALEDDRQREQQKLG